MSFSATQAVLGTPDFGLIHIDPQETAKAFQSYLNTASKITGVSLDKISRAVIRMPTDVNKATLVDLLTIGMKLFDAIVWLTAGRPTSHPLKEDPAMKKEDIPTMQDVAKSVFYCYFLLVTQARYPAGSKSKDEPYIPNFLRTVMGLDDKQSVYVDRICTFEPQMFDPAWARHVKFQGFGQEVLSRFGLGVAGYRSFGPFALYAPKAGLSDNLTNAFNFARTVARAPASWEIHPLTRNPNVLTARGNLNKNLGNLVLDCFSEEDIAEMVKAKILYKVPVREPTHRNYLQWTALDDISGTATIFSSI